MITERCDGCGRSIAGGTDGCQREFETLLAREYDDPPAYHVHRLMVDTYAMQHPDRYCDSAKSFAAHLTGLLAGVDPDVRPGALDVVQRWLSGNPHLVKPAIPETRGALTLADVIGAPDRAALDAAIERWARSAWDAYAECHALAKQWTSEAYASRG